MSLKVPYVGSLLYLEAERLNLLEGCFIKLFKNDYTPVGATILANLTEADFAGYAAIELTGWSAVGLNADNKAETEAPLAEWTMGTPGTTNTIYGVYLVDAGGALIDAERHPSGGILMSIAGQVYSYLPRRTYKSEF